MTEQDRQYFIKIKIEKENQLKEAQDKIFALRGKSQGTTYSELVKNIRTLSKEIEQLNYLIENIK